MYYRRIIPVVIIIALSVVFVPHMAHAVDPLSIATDFSLTILQFANSALEIIKSLLTSAIALMGNMLQSIISLKLTYGGATVYQVWKMLRDTCNMLFIVMFIAVAFGTILNVVWKNNFFYGNALMGVVIAAIAINFSLAIGQTVVWGGNYATELIIKLMPQDVGIKVGNALQAPQVVLATITPAVSPPPVGSIPLDKLTEAQKATVQSWIKMSSSGVTSTSLALSQMKNCLQFSKKSIADCYKEGQNIVANEMALGAAETIAKYDRGSASANEVIQFWSSVIDKGWSNAGISVLSTKANPSDFTAQIGLLTNSILSIFLLLVLALSFFAVIAFMVVRIPVIWFLLAISSVAFFGLALPKSGVLKEWFNNLLGWCIFSPLYLIIIYIGMYFISQQGNLMASLTDPQMPFFAGTFGSILGFVMAGFMFIGGAAWAMKTSFSLSKSAQSTFGTIGGFLGVSAMGKDGLEFTGFQTVAQRLGITPNVQALKERALQEQERIRAGLRGRAPSLFGTQEEAEASALQRFGVRGGAAKVAELEKKRVDTQKESLRGLNEVGLRSAFTSGNRDVKLAAGELLLEKGALTPRGFKEMQKQYAAISPSALGAFRERANDQLIKIASTKKFENTAEMESYLALISDPKKGKEFLDAAQKGKSKVIAIETAVNRGLITDRNGKRVSLDDALDERKESFSDDDLLTAENYFANGIDERQPDGTVIKKPREMPKALQNKLRDSMRQTKKFGKIIQTTSSPEQQIRILEQYADLKKESAQARVDIKTVQRKDRKYADRINKLRRDQRRTKEKDPERSAKIAKLIDSIGEHQIKLKDRARELQKNITRS